MARKRLPSLLSVLTGRVVAVKAETGGDLHIALSDATGDNQKIVVVEDQQNRDGVQFVKPCSVGRERNSLFKLALPRN